MIMENQQAAQPRLNIPQLFEKTFKEYLSQGYFPMDKVSAPWQKYALRALSYTSPAALNIPGDVFEQMYHRVVRKQKLTMLDFASLANNMEARTANELGCKLSTYAALMWETHSYIVSWNNMTDGIRQEAKNKMNELAAEEKRKHEEGQKNGLRKS